MLLAVAAGRLSDRVGTRRPMLIGSALNGLGALLPVALPGLPALFVSATLVGLGFMVFQIATQNATGQLGGPAARARNSRCSRSATRCPGSSGPWSPVSGSITSGSARHSRCSRSSLSFRSPSSRAAGSRSPGATRRRPAHHGGILALLRHRTLRRVFAINALLSLGWDLHTIFVPIYGAKIGLSASEIGGCCLRSRRRRSGPLLDAVDRAPAGGSTGASVARSSRAASSSCSRSGRAWRRLPRCRSCWPRSERASRSCCRCSTRTRRRAHRRGGRRPDVARPVDGGRGAARLRGARRFGRDRARVLVGRRVPCGRRLPCAAGRALRTARRAHPRPDSALAFPALSALAFQPLGEMLAELRDLGRDDRRT